MALSLDTWMAVGRNASMQVVVANVSPALWPEHTYAVDLAQAELNPTRWSDYVVAGALGVLQEVGRSWCNPLNIMVDGRVPVGSGLSSSSAMLCCAALASARHNSIQLPMLRMATVCARSERLLGLESGGMDQAISMLAQRGCALHIVFDPLAVRTVVPMAPAMSVVCVDTCVKSIKTATAATGYNMRVVECRFAALVLAKRMGLAGWDTRVRRLRDVQELSDYCSLEELVSLTRSFVRSGPWTLAEVAAELGMPDVGARFGNPALSEPFYLQPRALHVFGESIRVRDFVAAPTAGVMGALMNGSHFSCAHLFQCSCPELDQLTDVCRAAGALGARLTGAGWGGWAVCLVPTAVLASWTSYVWQHYYVAKGWASSRQVRDVVLVSQPCNGAGFV